MDNQADGWLFPACALGKEAEVWDCVQNSVFISLCYHKTLACSPCEASQANILYSPAAAFDMAWQAPGSCFVSGPTAQSRVQKQHYRYGNEVNMEIRLSCTITARFSMRVCDITRDEVRIKRICDITWSDPTDQVTRTLNVCLGKYKPENILILIILRQI